MGGKSSKDQVTTNKQVLDPSVRRAVDFLVNESIGLGGGGFQGTGIGGGRGGKAGGAGIPGAQFPGSFAQQPGSLAPDLSQDTLLGLGLLRGQFVDSPGADVLEQTVRGEFQGQNPFTFGTPVGPSNLEGVTQSITDAAIRSVGDRFSQAGRTGSPGEGLAIAGEVTRNLAPFAFGANEAQLNRQFLGQEAGLGRGFGAFESERARQLGAIPGLFGVRGQEAQNFLNVGQTLEEQQRLQALEPFQRLQLLSGPLATAISGAPPTQQITQPTSRNALAGGLGGALSGGALGGLGGAAFGPIGAGIGGIAGLLGLLG